MQCCLVHCFTAFAGLDACPEDYCLVTIRISCTEKAVVCDREFSNYSGHFSSVCIYTALYTISVYTL